MILENYTVVITEPIHQEGIETLEREGVNVIELSPGSDEKDLLKIVQEADALITRGGIKVTHDIMESSSRLKVVGVHGIGCDHVDLKAAENFGKIVFNTPDALTVSVAEMALAIMLSLLRRVVKADKAVRVGEWDRKYDDLIGSELQGKTVGVIGIGRIGEATARRLVPFNVKILYYDIIRKENLERELGIEYKALDELIKNSDIITLHVPATPDTYHLLDFNSFEMMKDGVYIVNTARGHIINTEALIESLGSGKVAGAALDVFEEEPLPKDHPLINREDVILTPHLSASSNAAMKRMAIQVANGVIDVLKGKEPMNKVV